MRRLLPYLIALFALTAVWGLAACGGDDGPSKDDVIADADKICREANEDLEPIEAQLEGVTDPTELAEPIREAKDILDDAIADLKDIDVPDDDKDKWDEFLEKSEEQIDLADDLASAAEANDTARIQEISEEADSVEADADEAAKDYGLKDCAEDDDEESSTTEGEGTDTGASGEDAIAQGDEICMRAEQEVEAEPTPSDASEVGPWAQEVQGVLDRAIADFEALSPPPDLEPQFNEYIGTLEEASSKLDEFEAAANDQDAQRLQELGQEFEELGTRSDQIARDIGFQNCAEES